MKSNIKPTLTRNLLATAVAGALALSLGTGYAGNMKLPEGNKPATKEQVQLTDTETIGAYQGWQDPDMARVAVHGGRALLHHMQAAHAALQEHKTGEARSALSAAEDFAEGLQLMIPYTVVADNIRNAKSELLSTDSSIVVDDMLPIYSSLDEMADYAPELAGKAKAKLDQAVQHMHKGEKHQAAEKLDEIAAEISATTVYLPVNYVENQIELARVSLDQDPADTQTANRAIDNALQSLVHATVNMHFFPHEKATAGTGHEATHSSANSSS
jgi:hypothetical protein